MLHKGIQLGLPNYVRTATLLIILILSFSVSAQSLHVGETKFLGIPDHGYVRSASWSCTHYEISCQGDETGAMIEIKQYFSGTATISVYWIEEHVDNKGRSTFPSYSYSWYIQCIPINIILADSNIEMKPGDTKRLSYSWSESGWNSVAKIVWESSDPNVATVEGSSSSYNNYATITAKAPGTVTITAKPNMGPPAVCNVKVKGIDPTGVSLPNTASTKVGESIQLKPTLTPSEAYTTYMWTSDNTTIASVSQSGEVSGKKTGTANISVTTENGKSASCKVTVGKGNVTLNCDKESGLYVKGTRVSLTASRSDADIYYTVDGSRPTVGSTKYSSPITINESMTLKAIATGDEYSTSDVLTREFQVTSLTLKEKNTIVKSPHDIPYAIFENDINVGKNYAEIKLTKDNSRVSGTCYIQGRTLYFLPTNVDKTPILEEGKYQFSIPESALVNNNGEPNMALEYNISSSYSKKSVVSCFSDWSDSYIVMDDGTVWEIWSTTKKKWTDIDNVATIIAYDSNTSAVIKKDKSLWVKGTNRYGNLGTGSTNTVSNWTKIMDNVKKAYMSSWGGFALKTDGTLWSWGEDIAGYSILGQGARFVKSYRPKQILESVSDFASDGAHGIAVKNNGSLWEWGLNIKNTDYYRPSPTQIWSSGAKSVAHGSFMALVIKSNGELYTWGWNCTWSSNSFNYFGIGNYGAEEYVPESRVMSNVKAVYSNNMNSLAIKNDNSLWRWGSLDYDGKTNISSPQKIMDDVAMNFAQYSENIVVKLDGTVWRWDKNNTTPQQIDIDLYDFPIVTSFSIPSNITLTTGNKTLLYPSLTPTDAKYSTITYRSSDESVVTVSSSGVVTGKKAGTATITVTIDNNLNAKCTITVVNEYDIKVDAITHGSVVSSKLKARAGETIVLTIKPADDYRMESLDIIDSNNNIVDYQLNGNKATFVMPALPVTIQATFVPSSRSVSISSSGYATFYDSQSAYSLPNGLSAQVVTGISNNKLSYHIIDNFVPKGVPVMLVGNSNEAKAYTLTSSTSTLTYSGTNLLRGSDEATTTIGDGYHYKLSYGKSGSSLSNVFGWYWGAQSGGAFQIEGHKAWLVLPKSAGARAFSIDGETLGIDEIDNEDSALDNWCDLHGRRINKPTGKGVYIKNGRTVVIK